MAEPVQIAVVGSGYVGLVAAVCFAEMGHSVICVDNDETKVAALQGGDTLIHENHLPELLERYRNTRVRFMTDLGEATRTCQAIFVAVGTPQSETGDADLSYVEADIRSSLRRARFPFTRMSGFGESSNATVFRRIHSTSSPIRSFYAKERPSRTFCIRTELL
jgi:threonine dehydrogenase-like Zn-dependent dehydrogenase